MKRYKAAVAVLFLLSLAVQSAGQSPIEEKAVIYYYDRMPFFGLEATRTQGIITQITRLIFEEAGIPYSFQKVPVNRIFENLKAWGPYCLPGAFKTPEREAVYQYSKQPIYQDSPPHYVIRKADREQYEGIHTIAELLKSGKTLGMVDSYSYGTWVDRNVSKYTPQKVVVTISDDQAPFFRMLTSGRFDFAFASLEEANFVISENPAYRDSLLIKSMEDAPGGNIRWLLFSRGFPGEWIDRLNAAIPRVKKSAAYRNLLTASAH